MDSNHPDEIGARRELARMLDATDPPATGWAHPPGALLWHHYESRAPETTSSCPARHLLGTAEVYRQARGRECKACQSFLGRANPSGL